MVDSRLDCFQINVDKLGTQKRGGRQTWDI